MVVMANVESTAHATLHGMLLYTGVVTSHETGLVLYSVLNGLSIGTGGSKTQKVLDAGCLLSCLVGE